MIYKVCTRTAWLSATAAGFPGTEADAADGFIHFSTAEQLAGTLARHFAGVSDLILVAVDDERLGPRLKWEPSRGGQLFPHLSAALPLGAVAWTKPLPDEVDGRLLLPEFGA